MSLGSSDERFPGGLIHFCFKNMSFYLKKSVFGEKNAFFLNFFRIMRRVAQAKI